MKRNNFYHNHDPKYSSHHHHHPQRRNQHHQTRHGNQEIYQHQHYNNDQRQNEPSDYPMNERYNFGGGTMMMMNEYSNVQPASFDTIQLQQQQQQQQVLSYNPIAQQDQQVSKQYEYINHQNMAYGNSSNMAERQIEGNINYYHDGILSRNQTNTIDFHRPQHQQQQQEQYDDNLYLPNVGHLETQATTYNDWMGGNNEAIMTQSSQVLGPYYQADENLMYSVEGTATSAPISQVPVMGYPNGNLDVEPGTYYPIQTLEPETTSGAPVTSIAFDEIQSAMYVATVTKNGLGIDSNRVIASTIRRGINGDGPGSYQQSYRNGRSAMMATYDTTTGTIYSSIQSHPEAEPTTLACLYESIFGKRYFDNSKNAKFPSTIPNLGQNQTRIPNHAYKPPYGDTCPLYGDNSGLTTFTPPSKACYQMGITTMIPITGHGTVLSVSPAGVRIHATGGLQLADCTIEGMVCATEHPTATGVVASHSESNMTHVTVGGIANVSPGGGDEVSNLPSRKTKNHIHCLDVWQGLRTVTSFALSRTGSTTSTTDIDIDKVVVTALGTSNSRGCILAGASDGSVRLLDTRRGVRESGKMKSHTGGVVNMAVSEDGTLIATTGYGSQASLAQRNLSNDSALGLYAYPDTSVLIYDIRYMGRGGIAHPFAGLRGGPRFVSFLPKTSEDQWSNRLLVASGQTGGGLQIIIPFQEESSTISRSMFIVPTLGRGEVISTICVTEDNLALGTNHGNVVRYKLAGYDTQSTVVSSNTNQNINQSGGFAAALSSSKQSQGSSVSTLSRNTSSRSSSVVEKQPLKIPSYVPPVPALSLEPTLLLNEDPLVRNGGSEKMKSIFTSYILAGEPTISGIGDKSLPSFGPLASNPTVSQINLSVSSSLLQKATQAVDFLQTIPTSCMNVDLFDDHRTPIDRSNERWKNSKKDVSKQLLPNPNKMIYCNKLFDLAYTESLNRAKRFGRESGKHTRQQSTDSNEDEIKLLEIPLRYRVKLRPSTLSAASFSHSDFNTTGLLPGWDYPVLMPNAFVSPVLMLVFFLPELRTAVLDSQFTRAALSGRDASLVAELGYLYHRIEMISKQALVFPTESNGKNLSTKLDAWAPSRFISVLSTMPEAEQLQILDGSPAAVASPRRPEAFYRFLLYHLDKEIGNSSTKPVENLCGIEFLSINEYLSGTGPETKKVTKQVTVDLSYQAFLDCNGNTPDSKPYFGELLQNSLCRATQLGAWNQVSKSYDTIVQRKMLTSLPTVLTLSPECAGCKLDQGLWLWQTDRGDSSLWLPERIEIELKDSGSVVVREPFVDRDSGKEGWREFKNNESLPESILAVMKEIKVSKGPKKRTYMLVAVVSMIRDDVDKYCPEEIRWGAGDALYGHHVLHARVSNELQKNLIQKQISELDKYLGIECDASVANMNLLGRNVDRETLRRRREESSRKLNALEKESEESSRWMLVNGFVVSDSTSEDARSFHLKFREPSLIVFRAMDNVNISKVSSKDRKANPVTVPWEVIRTVSMTNGSYSPHVANQSPSTIPGAGDLIAFDAEFVSVQEEESVLTLSGSKVTVRETRYALARISVIDARSGSIIFDDHIQPNEPVSDYLTRFSGIMPEDLSPKLSCHHLINSRAAYLKLRCLVERGCIFVGHGLSQDFWTANLAIPLYQIIDTVDIYHKPAQRFISLRFLTNFVLNRDMQQDVHDSVEDCQAALELYLEAVKLKRQDKFEYLLDRLYDFGQKTEWKLGVDDGTS